jgi:hypothetical protein
MGLTADLTDEGTIPTETFNKVHEQIEAFEQSLPQCAHLMRHVYVTVCIPAIRRRALVQLAFTTVAEVLLVALTSSNWPCTDETAALLLLFALLLTLLYVHTLRYCSY